MADISALSGLAPVEQLDLDSYEPNRKKEFQLPKRGVYTLQARSEFPSEAFGVARSGALTVQIDPTIVGPEGEGTQLRFTKVSAKVYQRNGKNVSQLGDYLKACGVSGIFNTPQDLANAAEQTANLTFEADLDWRAYHKSGFQLEGMEKFPRREDGTYQPWVDVTDAQGNVLLAEDGRPVRAFANLYIRNFIVRD